MEQKQSTVNEVSLDPRKWDDLRATGHRMLDDMFNYLQEIRSQPVWQSVPRESRDALNISVPTEGTDTAEIYNEFLQHIFPYNLGTVGKQWESKTSEEEENNK